MNAAPGVMAGASITKLIRVVVAEFAIATFFITIFDRAEVEKLRHRRGCDPRQQSEAEKGKL